MITICKLSKEKSLNINIKEDVNINFSQYYLIEKVNNLADILFDSCKDCCSKMPSLPPGAFAACKIREQFDKNMKIAVIKNAEKPEARQVFANKKLMEYTPVKYNSKLMNSIWGYYNRYSPHNIKSNDNDSSNGVFGWNSSSTNTTE